MKDDDDASPRPDPLTAVAPLALPPRSEAKKMPSLALPSARGRAPGLALPPRDEAKAPPTPRVDDGEAKPAPAAPKNENIQKRWDAFSALYAHNFRLWSSPAHQAMVSALELDRSMGVLEVGCGAGWHLRNIRTESAYAAGFRAVDFSPKMIELAGDRSAQAGCILSVGDAQALKDIWTDRFDRILSNLCIHIVPDPDRALAEFFRCCAPGGAVGFTVWGERARSPLFTLLDDVLAELRAAGTIPKPPPSDAPPVRSQFHLGQDDGALRRRAKAAGFVDVASWHVPCAWPRGIGGMRPAGDTFAESWLKSQLSSVELERALSKPQWAAVTRGLAAKAQALFDGGAPVLCDIVVVIGRKPVPPGLEKKAVAVDFFPPRDPLMDEAPEDILKRIVREGDLEAWREEEQQLADDAIAVALDNEKRRARGEPEVFPGEKVAYEDMCDDEKRIEDAKKMHIKMTRQGPSG